MHIIWYNIELRKNNSEKNVDAKVKQCETKYNSIFYLSNIFITLSILYQEQMLTLSTTVTQRVLLSRFELILVKFIEYYQKKIIKLSITFIRVSFQKPEIHN